MITIERRWQQRANGMTLAEIELELEKLPIAPKTDDQLIGRAVMMRRLLELATERNTPPLSDALPPPSAMVTVNIPADANVSCVQDRSRRGVYYYAKVVDGRRIIEMPQAEFFALAFSTATTAGVNGATWLEANPALAARLPKNPPPPPAAPPQ